MIYFAYGSNMCTGRLRRRVPSAAVLAVAQLPAYVFRFHKRGDGGSGKGDIVQTGDPADVVRGVLFRIDPQQKRNLDVVEGVGHGYIEVPITPTDDAGNRHDAFMYVADQNNVDNALLPYSWYKRFVVEGARQHGLPEDYIAKIEAVPMIEDPDQQRDRRNRLITC